MGIITDLNTLSTQQRYDLLLNQLKKIRRYNSVASINEIFIFKENKQGEVLFFEDIDFLIMEHTDGVAFMTSEGINVTHEIRDIF